MLGGVLGFAAGTFLFIAACGIIPELLHGHGSEAGQKSKLPVETQIICCFFFRSLVFLLVLFQQILAVVFGWLSILLVHFTIGAHGH